VINIFVSGCHSLSGYIFYSTSIVLKSFTFVLWWDFTMENWIHVILSRQNTPLLEFLQ